MPSATSEKLSFTTMVVVRVADDFVVGFEHRGDAERFLAELRDRFARVGLSATRVD